jgi:hypothetical protein
MAKEVEYRIIECSACMQKHRLVLTTRYERVVFDTAQMSDEKKHRLLDDYDVSYTLVYRCPLKNIRMQVTVNFPSKYGNRFIDSGVEEVQLNW